MDLMELENAVFILLFDNGEKLGTLAFAMPRIGMEGAGISSILVGAKYHLLSRTLAERAAAKFEKMALVSVNISLSESTVFKASMDLLNKFKKK